jgi:hypothetical protein
LIEHGGVLNTIIVFMKMLLLSKPDLEDEALTEVSGKGDTT